MPGDSGVTVVTNACAFYTAHAAADAPSVRHSLLPFRGTAPSIFEAKDFAELGRESAAGSLSVVAAATSSLRSQ
jgi:hypothetical protein